jgi:hypothetical protein
MEQTATTPELPASRPPNAGICANRDPWEEDRAWDRTQAAWTRLGNDLRDLLYVLPARRVPGRQTVRRAVAALVPLLAGRAVVNDGEDPKRLCVVIALADQALCDVHVLASRGATRGELRAACSTLIEKVTELASYFEANAAALEAHATARAAAGDFVSAAALLRIAQDFRGHTQRLRRFLRQAGAALRDQANLRCRRSVPVAPPLPLSSTPRCPHGPPLAPPRLLSVVGAVGHPDRLRGLTNSAAD